MIGDEILILRPKRGQPVKVRATMTLAPTPAEDDGFIDRRNRIRFKCWATTAAIEATRSIAGLRAEAQRSRPGKQLDVVAADITPDRIYLEILAEG